MNLDTISQIEERINVLNNILEESTSLCNDIKLLTSEYAFNLKLYKLQHLKPMEIEQNNIEVDIDDCIECNDCCIGLIPNK